MRKTNYAIKNAEALRTLVTDYMFKTFWYAEVKVERENALKNINEAINSYENLRGSAHWTPAHADYLLGLYDERKALESQLDEWIENAGAKWVLEKDSKLDQFGKLYAKTFKATGDVNYAVATALTTFYNAYGLEVGGEDMEYLQYVLGGLRAQHSAKAIAKSGQTVWTKARAKKDICETLLCALAEMMIDANCIRPVRIAPELEAKWARKNTKAQKKEKAQN